MVTGGMTFIKYLLFFFNFIIFIAGLILVGIGIAVQTAFKSYFSFFGQEVNSAAIFLIVIGFLIFFVSFFGCCGAYKENHCMVITFAVLLGAVFILEISAAIAAFLLRHELEKVVQKQLGAAMAKYGVDPVLTKGWDEVQQHLQCCGGNNMTDWLINPILRNTSSVPDSCCINPSKDCGKEELDEESVSTNIFPTPCAYALLQLGRSKVYIIGGVALGVAFLQIIGVIIACCLAGALRKEYTPMQ